MWRLTWAQMHRNVGKLIAVGIAIALGTGFITATFVTTNAIEDTALAAASASIGDPDVVVTDSSYSLTDDDVAELSELDGVTEVYTFRNVFREVTTGSGTELLMLNPPADDPRLGNTTLEDGRVPAAAGEIALPAATAERLAVGLGGEVTVVSQVWADDGSSSTRRTQESTVVGLLADGTGLGFGMPSALASEEDITAWSLDDGSTTFSLLTLAVDDGADVSAVSDAVTQAVPEGVTVMSGEEYARDVAASFTGGIQIFRALILAFAAVAMAVAGIVIANTFTVLVAQRTRTLALLRCVGATQRQVKRSVRLEALVLGVVSSVAGIALGLGIGQAALSIINQRVEGVPTPTTVPVDLATVLVPLLAGVVVTVVAASGAARLATSVAPLAAMRPVDSVVSARSTKLRPIIGWILTGGGFAVMAGALAMSGTPGNFELALAAGVLGGLVSIIGVVMAAITIVPAVSRVLGRGVARLGGVPRQLAATNSVRNPRRTTSTATALLVGVALVTMMSTGASMARTQLEGELDAQFAIDVAVTGTTVSPTTVEAVRDVDGVESTVLFEGGTADVATASFTSSATVLVADPATLGQVLSTAPESWDPGTVLADGYLIGQDGPVTVGDTEIDAVLVEGLPDFTMLVTADQAASLDLTSPMQSLWVAIADGADPTDVAAGIRDAVSSTTSGTADTAPLVSGGAIEKAGFTQVLDTLLAVVVGLLGVAVVIALIGVANTLSLSVVERRRENALLRALGLTRGQLRSTLAVEGVLLAAVGALVGLVLGLIYGWIGGLLMLGETTGMTIASITVPWTSVLAVLVVAVLAGVLASVLPARGAVKIPPVAALAAD
ncbi:ABC transporter permease [Serinibacter arcticus]|uniref:ABC transporter permease n=1 Tax=Serinibacter arcticus TaxID=1655435 RepID=A0A2U1ZVU1_9MICO|nr:FtsX-like permease family protein [Serinibacter arcticus]PWD51106.1 ABC transporter permease [Serinibacter arcticus]